MKAIVLRGFVILALSYLGFGALAFFTQRSFIYQPNFPEPSNFYNCPAFDEAQKLDINGTRAYYQPLNAKIAVVYSGNAGSACDRSYLKPVLEQAGYSYLFVEYSGFGGDNQSPTKDRLFQDVRNVVGFLRDSDYSQTLVFAESLGSGTASYHAWLLPPEKMVLITPFDTLASVARSQFPFSLYPVALMLKPFNENYDNIAKLRDFNGQLLIIHGAEDRVVPIERGKSLYREVVSKNKEILIVDGADHNNLYDFEIVWQRIAIFLENSK